MKAFYAGSFDPFTIGHLSIAQRALQMFEELIIGIGYNESKKGEWSVEERIRQVQSIFAEIPGVTVFAYDGLTAEVCKENGCKVLVRGIRNSIDFEKEKELADTNLEVFGVPTIMIPSEPSLSYVSSSMVRELMHFGKDVSRFIPGDLPMHLTKQI